MLHILNGDALSPAFQAAQIPGDTLPWGDMLMEGPARNALRTGEDWVHRAEALHRDFGIDVEEYLGRVTDLHHRLKEAMKHDEVVLWFGEDLFCQVNAAYVLRALAMLDPRPRLSVVFSPEDLGTHSAPDLPRLFAERRIVSATMVELATHFWAAYGAPTPEPLKQMLAEPNLTVWPALRNAIEAHLARFPDPTTGLGATEAALLRLLGPEPRPFPEVVAAWSRTPEAPRYGLGDLQVAGMLRRLSTGANALVLIDGTPGEPAAWKVRRTPYGDAVIEGAWGARAAPGGEFWLGGVQVRA